jgi:hypothetical protein
MAALAVLLSMMVIFAETAQAHNGTVSWDCDGWTIDLNAYTNNPSNESPTTIQVTVDGVVVDTTSDWVSYDNSGSWDPAASHTLQVVVDAWDDDDQPVYNLGSNSSFSPAWQGGEYSFTINVTQESCAQEDVETSFSISGSCVLVEETATFTISGELGEGLTLEVAGQTIDSAGPFSIDVGASGDYDYEVTVADGYVLDGGSPSAAGTVSLTDCTPTPSGWVCQNGEVSFMEDTTGYQGTVYDSEEEAATDPECAPPPPPSGWACVGGEVVFIEDATGFEGTLYETVEEAASDAGCIEVGAATTFTISGTCAAVDDVAGFTISGNLGEGVTLEVAGETLTATGAFSIDVGAAGSYPYTVTLEEGFVLAEGSPASEATIVIEDCTPTITIEALGVCVNDAPWLYYSAQVSGDIAPGADTVDIRWFSAAGVEGTDTTHDYLGLPLTGTLTGSTLNPDGTVVQTITNANRVPWVGLRLAGDGVTPTDWPGWVFEDGEWVQQDDGFLWARATGAYVEMTVNPTGTAVLSYPPSTPTCSPNPPDEVEDVEIVDEVEDVEELPFTGLDAGLLAVVATVLVGTGLFVVTVSRRREESH